MREFTEPEETLEETLQSNRGMHPFRQASPTEDMIVAPPTPTDVVSQPGNSVFYRASSVSGDEHAPDIPAPEGATGSTPTAGSDAGD